MVVGIFWGLLRSLTLVLGVTRLGEKGAEFTREKGNTLNAICSIRGALDLENEPVYLY
jgi:hypothetical protein